MNRKSWFILALTMLVTTISLTVLYWPTVYLFVIDPAARIVWLVVRMFLMVDQEVYWILLIISAFILVVLMTPSRQEMYIQAYKVEPQMPDDRVTYWKRLLASAEAVPETRLALERQLVELQNAVSALVDGDELGKIQMPTTIPNRSSGVQTIIHKFSIFRLLRSRNKPVDSQVLNSVDQIITSMETALENPNDRSKKSHDSY